MKDFSIGIILISIGIGGYLKGGGRLYGIDVPAEQGAFVFCSLGVLSIVMKIIEKRKQGTEEALVICQQCQEKYQLKYISVFKCPKCDGKLLEFKKPIDEAK